MSKLFFNTSFLKSKEVFPVFDENQKDIYEVKQTLKRASSYSAEVFDIDKNLVFSIDRESWARGPKFNISFANGSTMVFKNTPGLFKNTLEAELDGQKLRLDGNIPAFDFQVFNEANQAIGKIDHKRDKSTDQYEADIYDENYRDPILALVICLNNILNLDRASKLIIASSI